MSDLQQRTWIVAALRCFVVLNLFTGVAWSQPGWGKPSAFLDPPPGQSEHTPVKSCSDLLSLTSFEITIATAVLVPETGEMPDHCRLTGQILPEIRFELNLPTRWNRRFLMTGNGGYAGILNSRTQFLIPGFAIATTDTGHDALKEPGGSFAVNRQKLLDYAFRSLHVTAETAKRVIADYYGVKPSFSCFIGGSTGGRQALILAQRFPEDFDGIVSGMPILDFTGTMLRFTYTAQALSAAPIPVSKLKLLAERVYQECDDKDGLADGLIDDPRLCDFQPSRHLPKCPDGVDHDGCFTAGQIAALEKIYGPVMSRGKAIFPGWPVSAEVKGTSGEHGWQRWIISDQEKSRSVGFAEHFFRYMAFPEKNPNYELREFDFDKDVPRLEEIGRILNATDPDLSRFKARNGKLVMWFGWADQALNAQRAVDYYEEIMARMGPTTRDFFRLYMVPGMFHGRGGIGPNEFDSLTPLIDWVEKGIAPDRIVGYWEENGRVMRSRPLCPYPEVAKYRGTGSIDEADNFECGCR